MSKSSTPTPLAIPNDLVAAIEEAAELLHLSKQDTMRFAMRIGLSDLRAAHEIYDAIQKLAEDKGVSFSAWASLQLKANNEVRTTHPEPRFNMTEISGPDSRSTVLNEDDESYEATQERLRRAASDED